jgi:hypothetical protein
MINAISNFILTIGVDYPSQRSIWNYPSVKKIECYDIQFSLEDN